MSTRKGKKQSRKLDARRADYSRMTAGSKTGGYEGYHRPGSNKK